MTYLENYYPTNNDRVRENLGDVLDQMASILERIINLGANVREWVLQREEVDGPLIPFTLATLSDVLSKADSIRLLIYEGSGESAKIILRSLYDLAMQFEWAYQMGSDDGFSAYFINSWLKELKSLERFDQTTKLGAQLKNESMEGDTLCTSAMDLIPTDELETRRNELDQKLANDTNSAIAEQLVSNKYQHWYQINGGPSSMRELSRRLKHLGTYEFLYRYYSDSVHASNSSWNILKTQSGIAFKPERRPENISQVFFVSCTMVMQVLGQISSRLLDQHQSVHLSYEYIAHIRSHMYRLRDVSLSYHVQ